MDFTKILDAIDIIVNQKLTEAAFTRFINGTVVEIVNSEQNTYKVTTDNGKTNFIAQAIAADIDGGIVYEKNDEVKLLQLNGSNNSNENIYILGHSVDFTKQDLNEIKNHFIENVSQKITLNDRYTYILENSSDVIKDIKLKGSFGIKAQIKYLKQNSNNKKNYGFKISFKDKNNVNLLTYNLDVNTMIGEPYKFTDFVLQKIEKYLINTFIIDKINSIVIQAFNADDFEYKDLEIYSAIWTEDENEYQITFKNPTRVDYITTKENGKEEFSLQAILLKNNKTFATNTCKYLWFRQDASIDNNSDVYSSYGGEGWRLLNTVENITYLNINQEEYVQNVIKNDIGSCLKITNENTTSYHNYFKCVVLYNGLIIKSEVKHILNLDAAGDINFRLGVLTEKAATAQEILSLDENINTYTEDGFYLGFIFNKIEEYDNYEVVITRTNSIDDNNDKYIFSTTKGTLLNKNNQYYNILKKQIYENIYPSYTYNCVISTIKEGIKITLQTIEKTYYVLDSEVKEIIQYYNNKDSVVMPSIIKEDEWVDNYEKLNSGNWTAINIIGRKKLNIQAEWEYFWAFIHGSSQTADQVEEFNRLTRNGKDKGLYYGKGYRVTEDIKPLDRKIYYIYNENESKYVEQESLTKFDPTKIYYEKTDDLALFINADYIQTGTLRVGNESNKKFFASITNNEVSIGGFIVDDKSLSWINKNNDAEQVYLGQEGLKLGNSFAIDQFGNVNWNANNSPIRQIYCVNNTASLPTNKENYNNLPNDSDNTWHKIKSNNDKYYAQSSDGGASWAGPFLIQGIQGEDGNSIQEIQNQYQATETYDQPDEKSSWIDKPDYSKDKPYLWLKQTFIYTKQKNEVKIFLCGVWGKDGRGISSTKIKYQCRSDSAEAPTIEDTGWSDVSETDARQNLSDSTPVLWKWIRFNFSDGINPIDSIFILDRLKQNTFIRYADMDAFESDEYNSSQKGFFSQTRDIEIRSGKIYYVYNSETKEYSKVENPEKENLKSYYEFLVLKSDKDIYAVATANTGWIGTYVGYNANPSFSDYIWSYYLTELNRNNFMMTVLEEKKDDQGKDVDGIYTYTGEDGKNYIGITASAIKTGALKVGDSYGKTLFCANVQDKGGNVTIGGFTVTENSLSWMGKNDNGSFDENQYVYLGEKGLKLGQSFNITQTGDISWNSTNSPVKQIYSVDKLTTFPTKEDYEKLSDSGSGWHKKVSDSDLYYAQSSDGGSTWIGPFLIKGRDGKPGATGAKGDSPYHLQISSPVHCGSQQTSDITIKLYYGTTLIFSSIKYYYYKQGEKTLLSSDYDKTHTLEASNFKDKNYDIIIEAYTSSTSTILRDSEIITYSPLNTPILDLTNDNDTLLYKYDNDNPVKVDLNQKVSTTAKLYLNGEEIIDGVTYSWTSPEGYQGSISKNNQTITITHIDPYVVYFTCTATYKGKTYQKVFTVVKLLQGKDGNDGNDGQSVHIKYVDIEGFQNYKDTPPDITDKETVFVPTLDEIQNNDKTYYEYNEKTDTFDIAAKFSKKCYEYVKLAEGKTMYSTPNSNTGWMGTYTGTTEPTKIGYYKWTYYLTQLNRNNFMSNVLKTAEDNTGNYIDGIYSYTGKDGSTYIGINATAIQTGSLLIQTKQDTQYTYNVGNITFAALSGDQYKYIIIPNINGKLFIEKYTLISGKAKMGSTTYTFYTRGGRGTYEFRFSSTYSTDKQLVFSVDRYDTYALSLNDFSFDYKLKENETYCNFNIDKKQVTLIAPKVINGVGDFSYNNALFYLDSSKTSENFSINTGELQINNSGQVFTNKIIAKNVQIDSSLQLNSSIAANFNNKFYVGQMSSNNINIDVLTGDYAIAWKNCSCTNINDKGNSQTITDTGFIRFPWFPYRAPLQGYTVESTKSIFEIHLKAGDMNYFYLKRTNTHKLNTAVSKTIYLHLTGWDGKVWLTSKKEFTITDSLSDGSTIFNVKDYFDLPIFYWGINGICFEPGQEIKENGREVWYGKVEIDNLNAQTISGKEYIGFCVCGNLLPYNQDPLTGTALSTGFNLGCDMRSWNKAYINQLYLNNDLNANELFSFRWKSIIGDETKPIARNYRVVFGDPFMVEGKIKGYQLIALFNE